MTRANPKPLNLQAECPSAEVFAKEACSEHLGFHAGQLLQAEASLLSTLNYCEGPSPPDPSLPPSTIATIAAMIAALLSFVCTALLTAAHPGMPCVAPAALIRPTATCFGGAFLSALRTGIRVPAEGTRRAPPRRASSQGRRSQPPPAPPRASAPSIDFPTFARAAQVCELSVSTRLQTTERGMMTGPEGKSLGVAVPCRLRYS